MNNLILSPQYLVFQGVTFFQKLVILQTLHRRITHIFQRVNKKVKDIYKKSSVYPVIMLFQSPVV